MSTENSIDEGQDNNPEGSPVDASLVVNLSEKDTSKAIERIEGDSTDQSTDQNEQQRSQRSPKTDEFAKRLGRMERNIIRNFDQKLAENNAEFQRQLRTRDDEIAALRANRGSAGDADETAHQAEMDNLESLLAAALESGDSAKVAKLQRQISTADARFFSQQTAKKMGSVQQEDRGQQRQQTADKPKGPTPQGSRFIQANSDWWDDPDYAVEKSAVLRLDAQLMSEGFDPNEPDYYEELKARAEKKIKDFEISLPKSRRKATSTDDDDEVVVVDTQRNPRKGVISAGMNRGNSGAQVSRNGQVRLGAADIANMKQFGMDPTNNKHVIEYANSVRESNGRAS